MTSSAGRSGTAENAAEPDGDAAEPDGDAGEPDGDAAEPAPDGWGHSKRAGDGGERIWAPGGTVGTYRDVAGTHGQ